MSVEVLGGSRSVLRVSGEVDLSNVHGLRAAIDEALVRSPDGFVIDLSDVSYIDSAGIAAIMFAYRHLYPPGRLALVIANENVKGIFSLIHVEKLPGVYVLNDCASAENALSTPA